MSMHTLLNTLLLSLFASLISGIVGSSYKIHDWSENLGGRRSLLPNKFVEGNAAKSVEVASTAASSAIVGTEIILYSNTNYAGEYFDTRAPIPNSSVCINLPSSLQGSIYSLKIKWNVKDSNPNHLVCGEVRLWQQPNCYYSYWYFTIPGGFNNVVTNKYDYAEYDSSDSTEFSDIFSISCTAPAAKTLSSPPPVKKSPPPKKGSKSPPPPPPQKKSPPPQKKSPPPQKKSPPPQKKSPPPQKKSPPPQKKSPPPSRKSPSPPPPQQTGGNADCLNPQNAARAALNVGMQPFTWSSSVAASAQSWADTLASQGCAFYHGGHDGLGQNLYWSSDSTYTCADASNSWISEKQYFSYNTIGNCCTGGQECLHYTQIIWNTSTLLGCGSAVCDASSRGGIIWACDYSPAGNYVGEYPY